MSDVAWRHAARQTPQASRMCSTWSPATGSMPGVRRDSHRSLEEGLGRRQRSVATIVPPLHSPADVCILNRMVQYASGRLDASFAALSDPTRRAMLERLGRADASITDLATAFDMTLTGMGKHVRVLEQAELVTTEKVGRVRTCRLGPDRLAEETAWIERYRQLWDSRFDELESVVAELRRKEKVNGRNNEG
jgi:DNA-binding transcriptional ArsR family regulator